MMPGMVVGVRHSHHEACHCGCHLVTGLAGYLVEDRDTPKLAAMAPPMGIYAFDVPSVTGGSAREECVAYELPDVS